jgi:alkanesulfonate monooxygenase SsuD/methylene tetrahydromethanopterin reductase-like flavin-dependent oxidoreductase (luciferase family)
MLALRTGGVLRPQLTVEEAEQVQVPAQHEPVVAAMRQRWVVGTPATAWDQLRELASTYAVDEVMLHPVAGAWAGDDLGRAPARERTLELMAAERDAQRAPSR